MKEKILNYFIIIGVSIILVLGIVTTAFGQDNYKSNKCKDCLRETVPLYKMTYDQTNNKIGGEVLGYLFPGIKVTKTENLSNGDGLVIIKGNANYQFVIEENFLKCDYLDIDCDIIPRN